MAWLLDFNDTTLAVRDGLVVGRAQFPNDNTLSRRHVEFSVNEGKVFVKDLGSANGTFLRNRKLTANEPMQLSEGDLLRIGQTEFTLITGEEEFDHFKATWAAMMLGVFAIFCGAVLRPSVDYGRAFTLELLLLTLAVVIVATFLAAVFWNFVFRAKHWTGQLIFGYFALVIMTGSFASWVIWFAVDADWEVANHFTTAKIEYFCYEKFQYARCAENLRICPGCSGAIEDKKQVKMILNLREAERHLASPTPPTKK